MKLSDFKINERNKEKTAFYASDVMKPVLDLYLSFKEKPTNPPHWYDTAKFGAGKGVEEALLKVLKDSGFVNEDYIQEEHGRVDFIREGVEIHGYIDAMTKDGLPIEIKSINNANKFDIAKYDRGEPRENYVGQLSVYMDSLDVDIGYLFVCSIDGLHRYLFECKRIDKCKFKCGNITVDIDKEYKKWAILKKGNIDVDVMPDPFEYRYKYDIKELDWSKISVGAISLARNNKKVIGDWQVLYSPYTDRILELQGATRGYTDEEIEYIKEKTKGYSSKK